MLQDISVKELYKLNRAVYIDVRSEKEFSEGTIPGAVNIPIFNDEERSRIGTVYTRESPKKAKEIGLEIVSGKLPVLFKQIENLAGHDPVMLFCWRGGMRSKSLAVVLDLMGLTVYRLNGGYKAYRRSLVEYFEADFPFHTIVLRGNTGTGKTELLLRLKQEGYPVIDLEGLSNNRGSVFGSAGLGVQPSQKQFDALLFQEISRYQKYPYLLLECESKRIGRVTLPNSLFQAMQKGKQILIYDTISQRANRLVKEYTLNPGMLDELKTALERLKKRLGKANIEELLDYLDREEYEKFAIKLIKEYYDPLYGYPNQESADFDYCVLNDSIDNGIEKIKSYLNKQNFEEHIKTERKLGW